METIPPAPGDRFPVPSTVASEGPSLAIAPYSFTFRAAAKGRWIGLPLLTLFANEFAYVPPLSIEELKIDSPRLNMSNNANHNGCSNSEEDPHATRDLRVTVMAYVEELQSGALWMHGREAECRAAGRAYDNEIRRILCGNADSLSVPWATLCSDLQAKPEAVAKELLNQLTPRLVLRQRDVIFHRVLRREAPMPGGDPLHILRYDKAPQGNAEHPQQRQLLVCRKPHGLPVHPSGRCRKNSVTSILGDVFGGIDAHRYHAVPLDELPKSPGVRRVAIRHKTYGFELIRVWIGPGYVSDAAWQYLEELLSVPAQESGDEKSLGRPDPSRGMKVFVVHRLDAATSGVLIFGLDAYSSRVTSELLAQKSIAFTKDMNGSDVLVGCMKQYLARVCGHFDVEELAQTQHHCSRVEWQGHVWLRVDRPIGCLSHHDGLYGTPGPDATETWMNSKKNEMGEEKKEEKEGEEGKEEAHAGRKRPHRDLAAITAKRERMRQITVGQRTLNSEHADDNEQNSGDHLSCGTGATDNATRQLHETLKRAVTLVRCVSYDSTRDESVLECHLLTGRTHQVRVHLASLGHPICGDAKYFNPTGGVVEDRPVIQLHAWRYTLQFSPAEEPEVLVAPPPVWAEN